MITSFCLCFIRTFQKSKMAAVSRIGFSVVPKNDVFDIEMTQRRHPMHFLSHNMAREDGATGLMINQLITDSHLENVKMANFAHQGE